MIQYRYPYKCLYMLMFLVGVVRFAWSQSEQSGTRLCVALPSCSSGYCCTNDGDTTQELCAPSPSSVCCAMSVSCGGASCQQWTCNSYLYCGSSYNDCDTSPYGVTTAIETWLIAVIIVAVVCPLLFIITIVICLVVCARKRKQANQTTVITAVPPPIAPSSVVAAYPSPQPGFVMPPSDPYAHQVYAPAPTQQY